MKIHRLSFFSLFLMICVICMTICIICTTFGSGYFMKKAMLEEQNLRHSKLYSATREMMSHKYFFMEKTVAENIDNLNTIPHPNESDIFQILEHLVKIDPQFRVAMLAWPKTTFAPQNGNDFNVYCLWWDGTKTLRLTNPIEWRKKDRLFWIKNVLTTQKSCWDKFHFDPLFQCTFTTYSAPLNDTEGNVRGILGIGMSFQNIGLILKSSILNNNSISFNYYDLEKFLFRAPNGSWYAPLETPTVFEKSDILKMSEIVREKNKQRVESDEIKSIDFYQIDNILQNDSIYVLQSGTKLLNGANGEFIDEKHIYETSAKANELVFFCLFGALLFTVILSWITARHFTKPITKIKDSIQKISAGNFNAPLPVNIKLLELNKLLNSFEMMQEGIKKQISKLTKTTAEQEATASQFSIIKKIQQKSYPVNFNELKRKNTDLYTKVCIDEHNLSRHFYDFELLDDGSVYFCLGSFSQASVTSMLFQAQTIAFLWATVSEQKDPAMALWLVNQELAVLDKTDLTFDIFCGIYNPLTRNITFAASKNFYAASISLSGNNEPVTFDYGSRMLEKKTVEYSNNVLNLPQDSIFYCHTLPLPNAAEQQEVPDSPLETDLQNTTNHQDFIDKLFAEDPQISDMLLNRLQQTCVKDFIESIVNHIDGASQNDLLILAFKKDPQGINSSQNRSSVSDETAPPASSVSSNSNIAGDSADSGINGTSINKEHKA